MEQLYEGYEALNTFLHKARNDQRLTSTHICLYCVLVSFWLKNECNNPVPITRKIILGFAKMSVATYHKCVSDLNNYGYIIYQPSFNPNIGSRVYVNI